ncbi:MAG: histidine kinase dimerization/phospho-acceptor domain-containing protein, partial [Planctomycetota bacterium]
MSIPSPPSAIAAQARLLVLLRLLLIAIGLGTLTLFAASHGSEAVAAMERARWLLVSVCAVAAALAGSVAWVNHRWQLALHLVFDVAWIGLLVFWTGGVASPGVVLLFIVVLIGNLILPGFLPFVMPALSGMILSMVAAFYLSDRSPFPAVFVVNAPELFAPGRVLGNLAVQIGALFLVELLGGLLVRRIVESRVFAGGVLDQLGEGVLAIDRGNHIAYVNAEAARLLGLGQPPIAGSDVAIELSDPNLAPVRALIAAERLPVVERWRAPGGRQLVLRVTELHGRNNRVIGRSLVIADETRLRTLEDSMRRAEGLAVLGEMAAGIAHEVRNPLTSLRGCAQELFEVAQRAGRPEDARLAQIIVSESDRLARIVGDFLELSRMRPANRVQLSVAPVIQEVGTLIASREDLPAQLHIILGIDPDCPDVYADP